MPPKKTMKDAKNPDQTMKDVTQFVNSVLPREEALSVATGITQNLWLSCFTEQKNKVTHGFLTVLDIGRDAMSRESAPVATVKQAADDLWIQPENPSCLNHVILEVPARVFVFGHVHRLSDDIPCRSLAYALWKTRQDRETAQYEKLLSIAKVIPFELRFMQSKVLGGPRWGVGRWGVSIVR
jgi:hypothetical protein